jgi:hypothetical protein
MARALVAAALVVVACGGGTPQARPQVAVESSGTRYAPLPPSAGVKLYRRGEPEESYREVGRVTSSCPVKHWARGREVSGRRVCFDGLRQGARMLGGQAVVEIEVRRTRPPWEPDRPWLVMRGVVIRLVH